MSPPDKPGIPERWRRTGVVEDVVTATGPHTPIPPRERQASRPGGLEIDAELLSDAAVARTFRPGVRPWVAVIGVAITAGASIISTYMLTHAAPSDCASKGDMNAAEKQLSDLASTVNNLMTTVGKNADAAHNETSELRNTVNRNADKTEQTLGRLSDKLDLFMKR
jgi:hypothetical protein